MDEEILFSQHDIFNVLEGQRRSVRKRVESLAAETVLNASEYDLVRRLVEEFELRVPVVKVFIAECKFWKGEKAFGETLDQLLSYLSWRDTKTAVVLFNRNADFSAVLGKIAEMAPRHAHFKRDLGKSDESTFRYVFGQPNDTNREILLAVMAFDIPTPNTNAVEAGKK